MALTLAPSPAQAAQPASHGVSAAATVPAAGVFAQADAIAKKADKASKAEKAEKADKAPSYPDNLDGWIREALGIMKAKGIPGTYEGLHRNIMRESGGDPDAANGWDINAQNGTPSKGLLQVIQPTFDAYHVAGTPRDLTDPVANITAAANYAADKYGSIDNVDSAY
ncbi:transglycosylase SLT domain-containing protein [Streptomyces sp. ISL-100]|uniref:transglycosylase SLT domain-containing protein n=1 Tax=Streptomyces sp. ISL-100 TaxID=2819173 RepID=UPI0035AC13B6